MIASFFVVLDGEYQHLCFCSYHLCNFQTILFHAGSVLSVYEIETVMATLLLFLENITSSACIVFMFDLYASLEFQLHNYLVLKLRYQNNVLLKRSKCHWETI